MRIVNGLGDLKNPIDKSVLTIGVFDGVHAGHRKIIKKVLARAKALGAEGIVLTFEPHPLKVIRPSFGILSLSSLRHRVKLIEELGIDTLVILAFTKSIANIRPEEFIKNILVKRLGVREMYVGENFYLGKGAKADAKALERLARNFGFKVGILKPVEVGGDVISSTLIRNLIITGRLKKASKLLARPVSILGTVIKGRRRGRILGYPTANIDPHHEAIPPSGVYAVRVRFKKRVLKGVLNIGSRPTFCKDRKKNSEPTIEVHIFDFDGNIYGQDLEIIFVKKLRDEKRFYNPFDLRSQIEEDERDARSILN